ncbi:MAG: hypothetical protein KXJ61_00910 [Hydrogenophaga sp.]|nr:hypothetical protein [Hydrogenophaga sp.]MBW0183674.1 hypothetical protein [Hydrogenophaga sp.]
MLSDQWAGIKSIEQLAQDAAIPFSIEPATDMPGYLRLVLKSNRITSSSLSSPTNGRRMGNSSIYGIPRFYRVTWREGDWQRNNEPRDMAKIAAEPNGTFSGGKVVGDYIVPVAERIPDELLAEKRKRKLGLRIKLRIHPDGVLLGWDLQGPPGTGPNYGKYTMAGGDFQEADIYNGKALRMGWYIHPKTTERIETPF